MTTIMTEIHGGTTRRCDAICHYAKGSVCTCICGGKYHGLRGKAQGQLRLDLGLASRRGSREAQTAGMAGPEDPLPSGSAHKSPGGSK